FSSNSYSQSLCDYGIEVCTDLDDDPPTSEEACLPTGCFRYYYHVSIVVNNSQSEIEFNTLDILAELQVNGKLSRINVEATEACLNGAFADYLVDPTSTTVGFHMPDETADYYYETGEQLLFTIVVDAFPGEEIDLDISGTITYGLAQCDEMPLFDCNNCMCQNPFLVEFPEPDDCDNPGPCISFEDPGGPYSSGYGPVSVPVIIDIGVDEVTNYSIDEIDIAITMSFDNFTTMPEISDGAISASDISIIAGGSTYLIYAHVRNLQFQTDANGQAGLFRILVDGPVFQSSGGIASFSLENARIEPTSESCCKPCLGNDVEVEFSGFDDCTADITVRADALNLIGGACGDMAVIVSLNWTAPPNTRDFYKIAVELDFDLSGDISITGLGDDAIGCPQNQYYCGTEDVCFEILDANTIRYCFWTTNPVEVANETGFEVLLEGTTGCLEGVAFIQAYVDETGGGAGVACVPAIYVDADDFPVCPPMIAGTIERDNGNNVPGGHDIAITSSECDTYNLDQPGCEEYYAQCVCDRQDTYTITPSKDDNDWCGVSTFDLVIIRRHILGVEFFTSNYQSVAADANHDNRVTTSDLVELQKLILFIYENGLPANTSWRFVDKSEGVTMLSTYEFDNLVENIITGVPEDAADFVAVKIGDLNLSCTVCPNFNGEDLSDRTRPSGQVSIPAMTYQPGDLVTLPFRYDGSDNWVAFQAGIRFDPDALEFIGPSKGSLKFLSADNFGLTKTKEGIIRLLWFSPDGVTGTAHEGEVLFNLTFRAKKVIENIEEAIGLDDVLLNNLAYDRDGKAFQLELFASKTAEISPSSGNQLKASCYPNPFSQALTFKVEVPDACPKASVWLFDAFGIRLAYREVSLAKGSNEILLDDSAALPAGVLNWQVRTPFGKTGGTVVKQ
ncbi:MAG: hypothetical protein EPO28_16640, partial [Saprospiraceae bacterium]